MARTAGVSQLSGRTTRAPWLKAEDFSSSNAKPCSISLDSRAWFAKYSLVHGGMFLALITLSARYKYDAPDRIP